MSNDREWPDDGRAAAARHELDYELDDVVQVDTPEGLKAMADPTRTAILDLVLERAATTSELAEALDKPRGTVDHHVKALERAGLLRVVRTRKVRALTEAYWGRTARTIALHGGTDTLPPADEPDPGHDTYFVAEALREMRSGPRTWDDDLPQLSTLRHARIPRQRAEEFVHRLHHLALEFSAAPRGGDISYALLIAVYPSAQPTLKDPS